MVRFMECVSYQNCLDSIFHSYMRVKPRLKGLFDRDARNPKIICDLARELQLMPREQVTVRITGSKGKGTTTRLIARAIQLALPSARVGVLVSPEEIDHVDRMRINGKCITHHEFVECYQWLSPHLKQRELAFEPMQYFSPSGLFLLIALCWFKKQGVTHFVLEGGRGVMFDEVGNIPSAVSVVTSVFSEHLSSLGPTESHVASDKLSIARTSRLTILGPTAAVWNQTQRMVPAEACVELPETKHAGTLPAWVELNRNIAAKALECLLGEPFRPDRLNMESDDFPSFGVFEKNAIHGFYDALISRDSMDIEFYKNFAHNNEGHVAAIVSLPNDKDVERIVFTLQNEIMLPVFHVPLEGTRGYLEYSLTQERYANHILASIPFNNARVLSEHLIKLKNTHKFAALAVLGTQSFIRLFRRALMEMP